jgi:hypothetical protein
MSYAYPRVAYLCYIIAYSFASVSLVYIEETEYDCQCHSRAIPSR